MRIAAAVSPVRKKNETKGIRVSQKAAVAPRAVVHGNYRYLVGL